MQQCNSCIFDFQQSFVSRYSFAIEAAHFLRTLVYRICTSMRCVNVGYVEQTDGEMDIADDE